MKEERLWFEDFQRYIYIFILPNNRLKEVTKQEKKKQSIQKRDPWMFTRLFLSGLANFLNDKTEINKSLLVNLANRSS